MKPWRIFGFYALPVALLAGLFALFVGLGARLKGGASVLTSPDTLPSGIMVQPGAILGGQALRIGEAITNGTSPATNPVGGLQRPVGSFVYTRDGTQAFTKTGAAASAWSAAGGGAAAVDQILTTRAGTLTGISSALLTCAHEEFVNPGLFSDILGGSAAVSTTAPAINEVGAHVYMTTGTTASSRLRRRTTSDVFGRLDTNRFYIAYRFAVLNGVDTQSIAVAGMGDNSGAGINTGIGICGGTSIAQWVFNCNNSFTGSCNAGSVKTTFGTFDVNQHVWELYGVADNQIHVLEDFVEVTGSPFAMVGTPTQSVTLMWDVSNGTSAINRVIDLDWYHACWSQSP